MIDPALCAVGIADAAPVLELGGDLDRPADAGIDPGDVVVLVGTAARIHPVGLDADKARDRQSAGRVAPGARYGRGANRTCPDFYCKTRCWPGAPARFVGSESIC